MNTKRIEDINKIIIRGNLTDMPVTIPAADIVFYGHYRAHEMLSATIGRLRRCGLYLVNATEVPDTQKSITALADGLIEDGILLEKDRAYLEQTLGVHAIDITPYMTQDLTHHIFGGGVRWGRSVKTEFEQECIEAIHLGVLALERMAGEKLSDEGNLAKVSLIQDMGIATTILSGKESHQYAYENGFRVMNLKREANAILTDTEYAEYLYDTNKGGKVWHWLAALLTLGTATAWVFA